MIPATFSEFAPHRRGRIATALVASMLSASLNAQTAFADCFVQPTPTELSGTSPSGLLWTAVATGTALPVRSTATNAFNGVPGAVIYYNTTTGRLQFDPKNLDITTLIITYTTGTVNISGTTPGPFVYPSGTTTNAISPTTGTPKTFPAVTVVSGLPPTTFRSRVGMVVGSPLGPSLATTGDVCNIASTSGYWNGTWAFPIELVNSGSIGSMVLSDFATIGQNNNLNANTLGWGLGRGTFQYSANRVIGNQVGAVIPVSGFVGLTIHVGSGTQTQSEAGYASLTESRQMVKTGAGTLILNAANSLTGSTTVQGGRLQLANASALASSKIVPLAGGTVTIAATVPQTTVGGLDPSAGGLTDVGSGQITVAAGLSAADLLVALKVGRTGGVWTGTSGIVSSAAATSISSGIPRTVGWLDKGNGSVAFGFAAPGDTNLDGMIDTLDVAGLVASSKFGTGVAASWQEGDFNYDGVFDMVDVAAFVSTNLYNAGAYNARSLSGFAGDVIAEVGNPVAVPEPASMTLLFAACGFGGLVFLSQRALIKRRDVNGIQ